MAKEKAKEKQVEEKAHTEKVEKLTFDAIKINRNTEQVEEFIGNTFDYFLHGKINIYQDGNVDGKISVRVDNAVANEGDYLMLVPNGTDKMGRQIKKLVCVYGKKDEDKE